MLDFQVFDNIHLVMGFVLMSLCACDALPSTGPSSMDIALDDTVEAAQSSDFALVSLDWTNIDILGPAVSKTFGPALGGSTTRPANTGIGHGDQLAITVWEASADGLFSSAGIKQTQIDATVDEQGDIFMPYAGRVDVAGLSIEDVRSAIAQKLVGQAIDPQVQVALTKTGGNILSVVGDVAAPGQFVVPPQGLRLIDAIALAGGAREAQFETDVTVRRGDISRTLRLEQVLAGGQNNIWLSPDDTIRLRHQPRSFTVFGAVTSQNLQSFQTENMTLAEALAQAGGLNDNLADAGGVFLFRKEISNRLTEAKVTLPNHANGRRAATIYQLDMTRPDAFFLASTFIMRDDDIIYVANAPATDLQKFMTTLLSPLIGSAGSINALGG